MSTATPTPAAAARRPVPASRSASTRCPSAAKIVLWVLFAIFLFLLPMLNIPVITTEGSDFGGVLFTVSTYVLVALGLNIVVGYAGLLDLGYVGFYAIGAYTVGVLSSEHANLSWIVVVPDRDRRGDGLGRHPRRADAARAWRLPRHRHARASARSCACASSTRSGSVGRRASPTSRSRRASSVFKVPSLDWSSGVAGHRPQHDVDLPQVRDQRLRPVLLAGAHRHRSRAALRHPRQEQPGRAGLGGHARGRGRRRADGRADLPVQAARLRARCRHRWPLRGAVRDQVGLHLTRQLPSCCCRSSSSPPSSSVAPATAGASSSARSSSVTSRSASVTSPTSACSSSASP